MMHISLQPQQAQAPQVVPAEIATLVQNGFKQNANPQPQVL